MSSVLSATSVNRISAAESLPACDSVLPADAPATPRERPPIKPVTKSAVVQGALWTVVLAVLTKCLSLVAQFGIAWFLSPRELGHAATAFAVVGVISAFLASNLQKVLIQQPALAPSTLTQAFWVSLAMNGVAGVLLAALAPFAARLLNQPQLTGLLYVISVAVPVMGLNVVYSAKLYRDLRFRTVSIVQFVQGAIQNGLIVLLAALNWHEYAVVAPLIPGAVFSAAAVRYFAGPVRFNMPRPVECWALLKSSRWIMLTALLTAVQGYGVNLVLAAVLDAENTGLFFWASTLASQFVFLLATNLQTVLFPAMSRVATDPRRIEHAVKRACRILLLLLTPALALQFILVVPAVPFFFGSKWSASIPLIQWLTVGCLTQPLQIIAVAAMMSAGRFRAVAFLTGGAALFTCFLAWIGATLGGITGAAAAVGLGSLVLNALIGCWTLRLLVGSAQSIFASAIALAGVLVPACVLGFATWSMLSGGLWARSVFTCAALILGAFLGLRFTPGLYAESRDFACCLFKRSRPADV